MKLPSQHYHIIKNYIDPAYCKIMADYFLANMEEDRRKYYGTFGIGNKEYFFYSRK